MRLKIPDEPVSTQRVSVGHGGLVHDPAAPCLPEPIVRAGDRVLSARDGDLQQCQQGVVSHRILLRPPAVKHEEPQLNDSTPYAGVCRGEKTFALVQ